MTSQSTYPREFKYAEITLMHNIEFVYDGIKYNTNVDIR